MCRPVRGRNVWSIAYIITMTAALYTMYYAAFIFLFHLLYILLSVLKKIRRPELVDAVAQEASPSARFLGMPYFIWPDLRQFIMVGLLYLPWLSYAGLSTFNYVINKRVVENYLPLNFIRFFGDHFVAFSLGHLAPDLLPYVWAALPFVVVASIGFMASLFSQRKPTIYLYLYLFIPLLSGYCHQSTFSFHPTLF